MSGATTGDGELLQRAHEAVAMAGELGLREVAAGLLRRRSVEVAHRDGALETLRESTSMALTVTLFDGGRYSSSTTCDLRPDAIRSHLKRAAELTALLAPDEHRELPDPSLYGGQPVDDLELDDPSFDGVRTEQRATVAGAAAAAAADDPHVISATGTVVDTASERALVHSNGFAGAWRATSFWRGAQVTVSDDGDRRPEGSRWVAGRHRAALPDAREVGRGALERALRQRGTHPAATRRCPMVVENLVARRLLGALVGPLGGQALQQRRSFLDRALGKPVGSPLLTLVDDPLVPAGLGSRPFDGEGLAARRRPIFEGGILRHHFLDTYYARKLGRAPTTGSPSNLVLEPGGRSFDQLLADVGDGILVTSFLGGNSDPTTGNFSFGIRGHLIAGGRIGAPVSEMNITGTLPDLLLRLEAVGDDPYPYASVLSPTLVFGDVQFAGVG